MCKYKYIFLCIVIFVVELQRITKTCNYRKILYENEKQQKFETLRCFLCRAFRYSANYKLGRLSIQVNCKVSISLLLEGLSVLFHFTSNKNNLSEYTK